MAGRAERAQLLAKPYDPQPPQSTVGAKRKEPEGGLGQRAVAANRALVRGMASKERAEEEVERRRRAVEHAGTAVERPADDAELHIWRRYDRERAVAADAQAQLVHAEAQLAQKRKQVEVKMHTVGSTTANGPDLFLK